MIYYRIRKDELSLPDTGMSYLTYGIDAYDSSSEHPIRSIPDISLEKEPLLVLVTRCNDLKLELIHLDDVVSDFLA